MQPAATCQQPNKNRLTTGVANLLNVLMIPRRINLRLSLYPAFTISKGQGCSILILNSIFQKG